MTINHSGHVIVFYCTYSAYLRDSRKNIEPLAHSLQQGRRYYCLDQRSEPNPNVEKCFLPVADRPSCLEAGISDSLVMLLQAAAEALSC